MRIKFTSNSNYRSKSQVAIIIIATIALLIAAATITTGTPAALAQQPESETTDPQDMRAAVQQTQQISTQHVTTEQQQVNGLQFIPRWGPIIDIDSNRLMVLFANCETGEFAVSGQHIFTSAELHALQSFAIGLPDNLMSWLVIVENEGTELAVASAGAICADESGAVDDAVDLDISTKTTINNVVNQFIRVAGGQIINLGQIINIYQNITQVAYQYVNITGNNNTVNQIINQSASQIVAANGTNIGQIINQTAVQAGIITPEQAGNTTTPTVQRQIGPGVTPEREGIPENANEVCDEAIDSFVRSNQDSIPYYCVDMFENQYGAYAGDSCRGVDDNGQLRIVEECRQMIMERNRNLEAAQTGSTLTPVPPSQEEETTPTTPSSEETTTPPASTTPEEENTEETATAPTTEEEEEEETATAPPDDGESNPESNANDEDNSGN